MLPPVPFPAPDAVNLLPPTEADTVLIAAGILSATRTVEGNTEFQCLLTEAIAEAMTGHRVDASTLPFFDAEANAMNLANRAEGYRMRMVRNMILCALVLKPIPKEVAQQVA